MARRASPTSSALAAQGGRAELKPRPPPSLARGALGELAEETAAPEAPPVYGKPRNGGHIKAKGAIGNLSTWLGRRA
ncbi:exported hypothetical protein [Candidatus Sulfopaludibacter sp. SbA6]|nr:exported hypothetical protein [Candidatus Sulfopaludibacter sp. SbA6]